MAWTAYDRQGQVAFTLGWGTDWDSPTESRTSIVGKATVDEWPGIISQTVQFNGNQGLVYVDGRPCYINSDDTRNWQHVTETRPVKKPRAGKSQGQRYDWEWDQGRWRKVWR